MTIYARKQELLGSRRSLPLSLSPSPSPLPLPLSLPLSLSLPLVTLIARADSGPAQKPSCAQSAT